MRTVCIASLMALLASTPCHATLWKFSGSGVVDSTRGPGVPGETIAFSFVYSDLGFGRGEYIYEVIPDERTFVGVGYQALTPIAVAVAGSISGPFDALPITGLEIWHEALFERCGYGVGVGKW